MIMHRNSNADEHQHARQLNHSLTANLQNKIQRAQSSTCNRHCLSQTKKSNLRSSIQKQIFNTTYLDRTNGDDGTDTIVPGISNPSWLIYNTPKCYEIFNSERRHKGILPDMRTNLIQPKISGSELVMPFKFLNPAL